MDSSGVMRVVGMVAVEAVVILGGVYLYNKRNRAQSESSHSNTISTQTEDEEITSEYMRIDEDTTDQLCNDEPDSNLSPQQPPLLGTMETSTREDKNETSLNGRSKTGCHGDCHNADEDDDDDDNINNEREHKVDFIPHSDDIVSETDGVTTVTSQKNPELLDVQQDGKRVTDNDCAERKIYNREDETPVTKETFKYFSMEPPPEERTIGRHFEYVFIEHIDDSDSENFDPELIPDNGVSDSNGADRLCGIDQDHQSFKTSVMTNSAKDLPQQNTTSGGLADYHSNSESNHSERMKDDAVLVNRVTTQAAVDNTGMTDEVSFSDVEKQETLHSLNHDDNGPSDAMEEQGSLDTVDAVEKKEMSCFEVCQDLTDGVTAFTDDVTAEQRSEFTGFTKQEGSVPVSKQRNVARDLLPVFNQMHESDDQDSGNSNHSSESSPLDGGIDLEDNGRNFQDGKCDLQDSGIELQHDIKDCENPSVETEINDEINKIAGDCENTAMSNSESGNENPVKNRDDHIIQESDKKIGQVLNAETDKCEDIYPSMPSSEDDTIDSFQEEYLDAVVDEMVDNIICESIALEQYYNTPVLPPEEESLIIKSEEQTKSSQSLSECTSPEIVITTADETESVEDGGLTEEDETMETRNETMVAGAETRSTEDEAMASGDEIVSKQCESISTEDETMVTDNDADEARATQHETMVTGSQTVARLCKTTSTTDETMTPDDDASVADVTMATDDGSDETYTAEDETKVTGDEIKTADEDEKVTDVTIATATVASEKNEISENAPLDHSSVSNSVQEGKIDFELHGINTDDAESHYIPEILSKVDEHLYGHTDRVSKENNGTPTVLTAMEPDSSTEALNAYQDVTMATSDQRTHNDKVLQSADSMRIENEVAQDAKPGLTHVSGDVTPELTYTDKPTGKTQLSGDVAPRHKDIPSTSWTSENGFPRDRADTSENDIAPSRHQGAIPKQHSPRHNKQKHSKGDSPRSVSVTTTEENFIPQTEQNMATTEFAVKQPEFVDPGNLGKRNRDEFEDCVKTLEPSKKTERQTNPPADAVSAESKVIELRQRGYSSTSVGSSDRDVDTASDISADSSEGNRMTKSIQASPSISADAEYFGKLFDAVARRHKRTSLELMKCVDLTRRRDGFTLLHMAAKHDMSSVVSGLYTYGAFGQLVEVRAGKETGRFQGLTARDIAEKGRHIGIVRQIDKFYEYEYSLDPLHHAARSGNIEALTKLCENRGNVNVVGNHGNTPLYMAACAGRLKAVQLLLKYGADVTVVCDREKTLLHKAAEWGHYDVVQFFVSQCHIDVNARSKDGITPLHLAAAYGNTDIVTFLLDHKASSTIRSHYRESPLFWAVAHGNVDVVQLLVQRGARAELQPHSSLAPQDWNFLHVAASSGHVDMLQYLLDRNFDIRSVTSREMEMNGYYAKGVTALHLAAGHGHQNVVKFLTECGADVNARDTLRCTPLHYASQFGHQHAVQQLLHDRADTDAPDHHLLTPLHKAALNGHAEVSEILIHKGARLDIRASSKHSECIPLHMAAVGGHYDTALLL
ncbi:uncharacterized protein [Ptychodera flava]|uniref:uncharacterized protein n=1 Tax=Ptychodera flava TaxID=63121 RepID=UPI00396A05EC